MFDFRKSFAFYNDLAKNSELPSGNKAGNAYSTLGYTANGEASDWMLAERGIYALSPELGTNSPDSDHFFIESSSTVRSVLTSNYPWIKYTIMSLLHQNFETNVPKIVT